MAKSKKAVDTKIPMTSRIAFTLALFFPGLTFAHTRWFAESEVSPLVTSEPTTLYLAVWGAVALAIVIAGVYCERRGWFQFFFLTPRRDHAFSRAASTFSMIAGAFFLIAGTHEYLFSPNLTVESGIPFALVIAQIVIGLAFLAGAYARVAALCLGALWASAFFFTDALFLFEDIWIVSTALFIFIMGTDYFSLVPFKALAHIGHRFRAYALPILRLGTGTTLLILGFSEKILRPELGVNFLELHPWNFMQFLGFEWYSNYLFTLSAGAVESLFGLIFMLGIMTRLNALIATFVFTIPLFILGPIELAGHLPHFAAIVLLFLFGGGDRLTLHSLVRPRHNKHMR